uniref:Uncharacterized protein n=1 Tax=Chelydra serpentina TaxID=8475 RepID=A0A8C3SY07_CHESE
MRDTQGRFPGASSCPVGAARPWRCWVISGGILKLRSKPPSQPHNKMGCVWSQPGCTGSRGGTRQGKAVCVWSRTGCVGSRGGTRQGKAVCVWSRTGCAGIRGGTWQGKAVCLWSRTGCVGSRGGTRQGKAVCVWSRTGRVGSRGGTRQGKAVCLWSRTGCAGSRGGTRQGKAVCLWSRAGSPPGCSRHHIPEPCITFQRSGLESAAPCSWAVGFGQPCSVAAQSWPFSSPWPSPCPSLGTGAFVLAAPC